MKKDVYEHLAKTFLDKKTKKNHKKKYFRLAVTIVISFCFLTILIILGSFADRRGLFAKSLFVIQDRTPLEIDYDFLDIRSNKVRALSFDLNGVDLSDYNHISLSIRTKEKEKIDSSLKIKVENLTLERDAKYISGINKDWKTFTIPLEKFEKIGDWASIKSLTFVVEEWNVGNKLGKFYIDEVKFVSE